MSMCTRGSLLGVGAICLTFTVANVRGPAVAAPRAVMPLRPVVVRPLRMARPAPLRYAVAPALRFAALGRAMTPVRFVPLIAKPQPLAGSALLPRLGYAALLLPLDSHVCPSRPALPVTTLAPQAFSGIGCVGKSAGIDDNGLPPTSLVAGHNRNALYGPAYAAGERAH